jgi:nickel-dependent lactate racemase
MLAGSGYEDRVFTEMEVRDLCANAFSRLDPARKRVLVLLPDATRTAPVPLFFRVLCDLLLASVKRLDFIIALGTHHPMSEEAIDRLVGMTVKERNAYRPGVTIFNHAWDDPDTLTQIGTISADEIASLSNNLMRKEIAVTINKCIFNYDQLLIVGPTFPHEVVGFSGGNKYFFPGISGPDVLNFTHWLGALITNPVVNGTKDTPVRRVIDRAAAMIPIPRLSLSFVVTEKGLHGLFIGTPEEVFSAAADLSSEIHIVHVEKPFRKVLAIAPRMYDDLWVGAKCMYKLEPVVADGGELIIYAPHITEVSYTHGKFLDEIGYHTRDYFLKQMDRYSHVPGAVLAHSSHVKGIGTFEAGVETPRINVVLATGIPEERCRKINLGYRDPKTIEPTEWRNCEDEGILCVPNAGETLYRLAE